MTASGMLGAGTTVGFVGLGNMGTPMAGRLVAAGYEVHGFDLSSETSARFAASGAGATAVDSAAATAAGAPVIVLSLPNSAIVASVLTDEGVFAAAAPGTIVVDMSSSEPPETRRLAAVAAEHQLTLIDAPVSGGVGGAVKGTLTIMVGGEVATVDTLRPLLECMGTVVHAGDVGAGHALKALNNLLSASHLLATSEAVAIGRRFGLDPEVMIDAINQSTGRSWSTQHKFPNFVLNEHYDSGFALDLMVKDLGIAVELAKHVEAPHAHSAATLDAWRQASRELPPNSDHTEIARWADEEHS
jgi:3-hydroxyisobutyrate dehydrogenase